MREFKMVISEPDEPIERCMKINVTRLAAQTGYSTSHISRVLTRRTRPSIKCAQRMSLALRISIDDLCNMIAEGRISAAKTSR